MSKRPSSGVAGGKDPLREEVSVNEPGYYIAPDNLLLILAITGAMAVLTMAESIALWRVQHLARQMDRRRWFAVLPLLRWADPGRIRRCNARILLYVSERSTLHGSELRHL